MSNSIYRSAYTAAQIEAAIGKGPRVNASGYWEVWNVSTGAYESTGVGAGVKPPTVVTQASQMTNHGYIYIYEGSEDGYTPGYFYYWNGSAWAAGGAYRVAATDPTLSVAGAAADAKACGDLKSAVSEQTRNLWPFASTMTFVSAKYTRYEDGSPFLPAGTYTFSAIPTSNDTAATTCRVRISKSAAYSASNVMATFSLNRNTRNSYTFTISDPAVSIEFSASNTSSASTGDTATFANIQIDAGETTSEYIPHISAKDFVVRESVVSVKSALGTTNNVLQVADSTPINWYKEKDVGVRYDTGEDVSSSTFSATNYIDIRDFDTITYKQHIVTLSTINTGIAFYDESKTFIPGSGVSGIINGAAAGVQDNMVTVPSGAYYVRCTIFNNQSIGAFSISGVSKLVNQINNSIGKAADDGFGNIVYSITNGYGVRYDTGELTSSSVFVATDYIYARQFVTISYPRLHLTVTEINTGLAFYDENKEYLSGISSLGGYDSIGYEILTVAVPASAYYIRVTLMKDNVLGDVTISGKRCIDNDKFQLSIIPEFNFNNEEQVVNFSNGNILPSSVYASTDYVYCHGFDLLEYTNVYRPSPNSSKYGMAFYDSSKNYIMGYPQIYDSSAADFYVKNDQVIIPPDAYYCKFSYFTLENINTYEVKDFELKLIKAGTIEDRVFKLDGDSKNPIGLYPYKPKTVGVENFIKNMKKMVNYQWTPLADLTRMYLAADGTTLSTSTWVAGVKYTGVPYAISRNREHNVGCETSLESFASAVSGIGSRMYDTSISTYNNYCYFGVVCSSFICGALGLKIAPICADMAATGLFELKAPAGTIQTDSRSLELGDLFIRVTGLSHVAAVSGILTDTNGDIQWVEITEATQHGYLSAGKAISRWYRNNQLWDRFADFDLYTYKYMDDVEYVPSNLSRVFPEIMSYQSVTRRIYPVFGDNCVVGVSDTGLDLCIQNGSYSPIGYRKVRIYRNGELVDTISLSSTDETVSVGRTVAGDYRAYLETNNGTISQSCSWTVVGGNFSYSLQNTTLTLTYDTDSIVWGIQYKVSGNSYAKYRACKVTGTGSIEFTVPSGATSIGVVLGTKNGATHISL